MLLGTLSPDEQNSNPFLDSEGTTADHSQSVNPFDFLSGMQIGSTILFNPDWSIPQSVTMDLIGGGMLDSDTNNNTQSKPFSDVLDIVFVELIPFTGKENPT